MHGIHHSKIDLFQIQWTYNPPAYANSARFPLYAYLISYFKHHISPCPGLYKKSLENLGGHIYLKFQHTNKLFKCASKHIHTDTHIKQSMKKLLIKSLLKGIKLFIRITFNPIKACFSNKKNTVSDQTNPIVFIQNLLLSVLVLL